MKLLFVTCLKEDQQKVADIFEQASIKVFSATDTIGFKEDHDINLLDRWFASGTSVYNSIFLFSFTSEDSANQAMQLIKSYNESSMQEYPLRAFILPVEQSSY